MTRLQTHYQRLVRVCRQWTTDGTADVAEGLPVDLAVLWRTATALVKGAAIHHNKPVSCHKRCSACCRGEIVVTPIEAREIASRLTLEQADAIRRAAPLNHLRKCPLLTSNGECGIYSIRPVVCRLYHATSPSADCEPIDGMKEALHGEDFDVIRLVGYAAGIGEMVRLVQAELEQAGKAAVLAVPIFDFQPHNKP